MWVMTAAHFVALFGAAIILIAAAISDAFTYRIPNVLCGLLILLFPLFIWTAPQTIEWKPTIIIFRLVLGAGLAMFFANLAGAGDIKLLAAAGLWAGPHFIAVFLVTTALAGGLVALTMMALTFMRNRSTIAALPMNKVPIPYGIAIAIGGLTTIYQLTAPLFFAS